VLLGRRNELEGKRPPPRELADGHSFPMHSLQHAAILSPSQNFFSAPLRSSPGSSLQESSENSLKKRHRRPLTRGVTPSLSSPFSLIACFTEIKTFGLGLTSFDWLVVCLLLLPSSFHGSVCPSDSLGSIHHSWRPAMRGNLCEVVGCGVTAGNEMTICSIEV